MQYYLLLPAAKFSSHATDLLYRTCGKFPKTFDDAYEKMFPLNEKRDPQSATPKEFFDTDWILP